MKIQWQLLWSRLVITSTLLGFASGLPLALTTGTLQAWYTTSGVSLIAIGSVTLIGQPYIYKFIWAPLMDRFIPPVLGRRRGWIIITQLALIAGIAVMSIFSPTSHGHILFWLACLVAFLSASQDISINGWMADVSHQQTRGLIAAAYITGYRFAVIVSGALAMVMAQRIGWHTTYLIMAALMFIGILTTCFTQEPDYTIHEIQGSWSQRVTLPFIAFFRRYGLKLGIGVVLVMILYKFADAFALTLNTAFLLRGMHFSLTDVGTVNKAFGMVSSIIGGIIGGLLMTRFSLFKSLFYFGILQVISNLAFVWLALVGTHFYALATTVFIEQFCGGLGNTAFVALIMALCDQEYSAAQFALLTALTSIGRVYLGPPAAILVDHVGWIWFYLISCFVGLPGVFLLFSIRKVIREAGSQ